jgi:hypothetical protein
VQSQHHVMRAFGAVALAAALVSACGSSAKPKARPKDDPGPPVYAVTLNGVGCVPDTFNVKAGDTEFRVTNRGTKHVEEMEVQTPDGRAVGDVEGVPPGHTRSFVVHLKVGTYRVRCPEDAPTGGKIIVK